MHLYKNKNGRWRAIVQHQGQRKSFTAGSKLEARRMAMAWELKQGAVPAERVTVDDIIEMHLKQLKDRRSPITIQSYRDFALRLPTEFLNRNVTEVDVRVVSGLYEQLIDAGVSPHTVQKMKVMLSGAWQRAITAGYDTRNPIRMVPAPYTEKPHIDPPTPRDVNKLMDAAETDQQRLFIRLAAATGARRGELCGLQWDDFDFDKNSVILRRSVVTTRDGVDIRETKTGRKGHRVIAVGDIVMQHVRRWRVQQLEQALAAGLPEPVWVFSQDAGVTPWRPEYPTSWFIKLRNQTGASCRLHDLRHFAATQLLAGGMSLAQVAGRLGHASVATTAATYAHWVPAMDREAAEILDRSLHG
jgi:integrase